MTAGTGGIGGLPPVGAGVCQPDEEDCSISHATTGWCLQATGLPVIVVTRWACDPNDAAPTVTMLDPSTGVVIPNQVVTPCDGRDFEINHLCDFDTTTGDVIAAVTQIFEWNEATGQLDVRLVAADDPTGPPYIVQGVLRQCHVPTWVDVETSIVCGDTAGVRRQLTQMIVWDTRNGLLLSAFYLDADGNVAPENPGEVFTVGDCWTPTLPSILDELEEANGTLTSIDAELNAQTLLLTDIDTNTDGIEPLLTLGNANTTTLAGAVKLEDDPALSGDPGIPALARRNDAAIARTTTDGDYTHIATDAAGRVGIADLGGSISIDDNGGSVTVDGTVAVSNFPASFEIANDVGNPIPVNGTVAVSNNFLTDAQLRATPVPVSGTLGNTEARAEDSPVANGDLGFPMLARRNDTAAVLTSADGDYTHIATDSAGRVGISTLGGTLGVTDAALATTNATLALIAGYTDGIEGLLTATNGYLATLAFSVYQEDVPHVSGNQGTFVLAVRNDADAVRTSNDGDYSPISVDSAGRVKVTGLVTITDGAGPITVDGTVSAAEAKIEDAPHASGDTGFMSLGVRNDLGAVRTSTDGDYSPISTDAAGRIGVSDLGGSLSIDDNGGSITVDGAVAITNSSIEISNDVGNPVPVSGTVTITDGSGPITVDGTTANAESRSEDSVAGDGDQGLPMLAVRNDLGVPRTSADGDYSMIATDSAGRVGVSDLGGSLSIDDNGGSITVDGTVAISNPGLTDAQLRATPVPVSGTVIVGPTVTPGTGAANLGKAEDAAHASGDVGVFALGVRNDLDAVRTSADGDYSPISTDSSGRLKIINPAFTEQSLYRNINTNATGQVVKGSSGRVVVIHAANISGNTRYLKLYNKATAPVAADTPVMTIALEAPSNANTVTLAFDNGALFGLGIGVRATTGVADGDTGNPGANEVIITIGFQ